jgi:predicted transcriptional regulator YdeE
MSKIENIAGGKLVGIKTATFTIFNQEKYDPKVIPTAWKEFFSKYQGSGLPASKVFYSAAIPNMSMDIPMDYYAGIIVDEGTPVPAGFESVVIPTGNYLCVTHNGPITELAQTFGKAYGAELPASGKEMRNAPHLEIYNSDKDPMDPAYSMEVAIPVN